MNKTKIEWCDYTINPVKGLCPMACKDKQGKEYCYARRMYKRFGWNPDIRWSSRAVDQLAEIKEPSRIFIGSTIELFGDWIKYWWLKTIFDMCLLRPQHTFIFLTKKPENLIKWSPFPENCWVGVSVTNADMAFDAINCLDDVQANVRFLSFEPLLASRNLVQFNVRLKQSINWVIIGQQTPGSVKTTPKIEWVREIVQACDKVGIPIFLKDNLTPIWDENHDGVFFYHEWAMNKDNFALRQEFPK